VLIGGLYALFACGLSLMFGVMKVVNLAHGDLAVVAATSRSASSRSSTFPVLLSFLIVVPLMALLGYVLQRTILQGALDRSVLTTLMVTFGLSVVIENGLLQFFTANSRHRHRAGPGDRLLQLGSQIQIGYLPVVIFAVAVVVLLGLQYFLSASRYGRLIRAVADDKEAAQLAGADYRHVFGIAAAIAFGTVALAASPTACTPSSVPDHGHRHDPAVRVRGGGDRRARLLWGTLLGGVVLGVAQQIGAQISLSDEVLAGFIVFLAVLVLRPQGLISRGAQS
jgi:Branched-chain amino acid ABC-type transport system, permease components